MQNMDSAPIKQNEPSEDVVLELECEIEEDVKAELDDFVRLSHLGQFKDAHELYDECLSDHDDWFPITAEYADCLLREGNFELLAAFCEEGSMKFQDLREYALLELMGGIGELLPRDAMLVRLRCLWPRLALEPPFTSLRDTDIHLLKIVLQILVFSKLNPEDLHVSLSSTKLWSVFNDWFYFLLRHDYFWEAQRVSHSLFHTLPQPQCQDLLRDYIAKARSVNFDQEPVKIAVSSMVQHYICAFNGTHASVLAVVQWNDAITWALFGVTLGKVDEDPACLFSRLCLRRSLEVELYMTLPLGSVNEKYEESDLLHEAAMHGDTGVLEALTFRPGPDTLDRLNRYAFLRTAPLYRHNVLPFLDPEIVNAQDGYQRTPLHWASLLAQSDAVENLLSVGKADAGLLDWFGCTPLHYAIRSRVFPYGVPRSERGRLRMERERLRILKALLKSSSTSVNTRNSTGQTPLNMAIVQQSYDVAEVLLEHNATIETRDYGALLLLIGEDNIDRLSSWKRLLSKYDHSEPLILGERSEIRAPAPRFNKASLCHPGTIDLDTYAALCLRALHPSYTNEFIPPLCSLLECEFSVYELPESSQLQSYISERQRLPKRIVTGGAYPNLLELALPESN